MLAQLQSSPPFCKCPSNILGFLKQHPAERLSTGQSLETFPQNSPRAADENTNYVLMPCSLALVDRKSKAEKYVWHYREVHMILVLVKRHHVPPQSLLQLQVQVILLFRNTCLSKASEFKLSHSW